MRLAAQNEINAAIEGVGQRTVRVSIVRREKRDNSEQDAREDVLCILDTNDVAGLEVVSPEDTAQHETLIVPLADDQANTEEDQGVVMEQLILPGNAIGGGASHMGNPSTQMVAVVVPFDAVPGQDLVLELGGRQVIVSLPMAAEPGQRIQVPVPLPDPGPSTTAIHGGTAVVPTTLLQQSFAVAWKNFHLTFNCRCEPGLKGCCNVKCCELMCYFFLFAIMAMLALFNTLIQDEDGSNVDQSTTDAIHRASLATYCANGVQDLTFSGGTHTWGGQGVQHVIDGTGPIKERYIPATYDAYGYGYGHAYDPYIDPMTGRPYESESVHVCDVDGVSHMLVNFGQDYESSNNVWTSCDESDAGSSCWASVLRNRAQQPQGKTSDIPQGDGNYYSGAETDCGVDGQLRVSDGKCTSDIDSRVISTVGYRHGSGLPCRRLQEIWISDDPTEGSTPASQLKLFPSAGMTFKQVSELTSTYNHVDSIWMEFRSVPDGEINSRVLTAQSEIRSASSNIDEECGYSGYGGYNSYDAALLFDGADFNANKQTAAEYFYARFPAFALELEQSIVAQSAISLHYTARIWSQDETSANSYNVYNFARVYARDNDQSWSCQAIPSDACGAGGILSRSINLDLQLQGIISAVSNVLIRTAIGDGVSLQTKMVPMPPVTFNVQAEQQMARDGMNNGALIGWTIMFPLITMLLTPSLCSMMASEHEDGLLEIIKLEGGRINAYFLGSGGFIFCYSVAFTTTFVITLVGSGASDGDNSVHIPALEVIVLTISGAVAQTGFVLFVGFCGYGVINKARNAALFAVMIVLLSVMVSWFLMMFYGDAMRSRNGYDELAPGLDAAGAPWLLLFLSPPLAYAQASGMMLWYGGSGAFSRCVLWLWLDGIFYGGVAVAYSQGLLTPKQVVLKAKRSRAIDPDIVSTGGGVSSLFQGDDDVEAERERVVQGNSSDVTGAAIVIRNLVKSYDSVSHGRKVSK